MPTKSIITRLKKIIKTQPLLYKIVKKIWLTVSPLWFFTRFMIFVTYIYVAKIVILVFGKKTSYFLDNNLKRLLVLLLQPYQYRLLFASPLFKKQASFIKGYRHFKEGDYENAIDCFAASIEKEVLVTSSKLLMIEAMVFLGRVQEAEQQLNGFESHDIKLSREIDFNKINLYLIKGNNSKNNYQRAFEIMDKYINNDKEYANHWRHTYLAEALGKEDEVKTSPPEAFRKRPKLTALANQINLALLDYKSVDYHKTSSNIGDYIQTVAVMRHIARHIPDDALIDAADSNSDWQIGSKALKESFQVLRESWGENERRHTTSNSKSKGKIVLADRDCSWNLTSNPANNNEVVWLPIFGWFAHKPFDIVPVIPLPDQYLPIFFSFHLQYPEHLTEACIAYLKKFAPIGCRDITTRDLLMNQGIDAFFSGCVTTTLALAGAPEKSDKKNDEILDVDADIKHGTAQFTPQNEVFRTTSFDENITESLTLLRRFRDAKQVVTSRLHCYLPTRALSGTDNLTFTHPNQADPRFEGLIDIDDDAFDIIRNGLTDLLDKILGKIMAGDASADDIYAYWCELTMPLMEQSKRERSQYKKFFVTDKPVVTSAAPKQATKTVPIALAFDANIAAYVPALINSIEANKSWDTRYIMLVRDIPDNKIKAIEKACKQAPIQWFEMGKFLQGEKLNLTSYITISTMDRLFLPDLLPDTDKIIYLDIDMIVEGDVAELYQTELLDTPLAAKEGTTAFSHVLYSEFKHIPANKLLKMRKFASVSNHLLEKHFNAGVLVASLEKMRQDNFTEQANRLAVDYKANDQHILNFYAQDNYVKLSSAWNAYANKENLPINEQKIFHWAGPEKPWHKNKTVAFKHIWQKYADMQD